MRRSRYCIMVEPVTHSQIGRKPRSGLVCTPGLARPATRRNRYWRGLSAEPGTPSGAVGGRADCDMTGMVGLATCAHAAGQRPACLLRPRPPAATRPRRVRRGPAPPPGRRHARYQESRRTKVIYGGRDQLTALFAESGLRVGKRLYHYFSSGVLCQLLSQASHPCVYNARRLGIRFCLADEGPGQFGNNRARRDQQKKPWEALAQLMTFGFDH